MFGPGTRFRGLALKLAVQAAGTTEKKLAAAMGHHRRWIERRIYAQTRCKLDELLEIAAILQADPRWLAWHMYLDEELAAREGGVQ